MRGMIDNKPNLNLCLFRDTTAVFGQFGATKALLSNPRSNVKNGSGLRALSEKTVSKIDTSFDVSPPCPQNHHFPHFLGAGWRGVRNFGLIRKNISQNDLLNVGDYRSTTHPLLNGMIIFHCRHCCPKKIKK